MPWRQGADHLGKGCLAFIAKQLVNLADVAKPFWVGEAHIEDQGFQKVQFAVVPEVVAFAAGGILDDGIRKDLSHYLVTHFVQAVPTVAVLGADQVQDPDGVAAYRKIGGHVLEQLGFWIGDDDRFSPAHCL